MVEGKLKKSEKGWGKRGLITPQQNLEIFASGFKITGQNPNLETMSMAANLQGGW